jgi:hypothetical protein
MIASAGRIGCPGNVGIPVVPEATHLAEAGRIVVVRD